MATSWLRRRNKPTVAKRLQKGGFKRHVAAHRGAELDEDQGREKVSVFPINRVTTWRSQGDNEMAVERPSA